MAETGHYLTCLVKFCTVPPKLEKNVLFLLLSGEGEDRDRDPPPRPLHCPLLQRHRLGHGRGCRAVAGQPGHISTAARGILPRLPDIQEHHHGLGAEGASRLGWGELVEELVLRQKMDINKRDGFGNTTLMLAV